MFRLVTFTSGAVVTVLIAGGATHLWDVRHTASAPNYSIPEKAPNEFLPDEEEELRRLLLPVLGTMRHDTDLAKVKKILKHQADIALIEFHVYDQTKEQYRAAVIYRNMRTFHVGYFCSGQADLFLGMLHVYGIPARRILGESISADHPAYAEIKQTETYDSHSTVEVKIDGRWILADPTYFMLPKLNGQYVSLREALESLCKDRSTAFEFEGVSDGRLPIRCSNEYFRALMFARVIVYKPFHRYPYDDVYVCPVRQDNGVRPILLTLNNGVTLETLTPAHVPTAALRRYASAAPTVAQYPTNPFSLTSFGPKE